MKKFSSDRLDKIFSGIRNARIAVIGDLMLDKYIWGVVDRISPEAPVPVLSLEGESYNLGGAANVAANVGSLGANLFLFGVVGDDPEGKHLLDAVNKSGFDSENIIIDPTRPTSVKTRVIAGNQHIVRIDREKTDGLDKSIGDRLLSQLESVMGQLDAVILEDYNKGVLSPNLIEEIIALCQTNSVSVGVDPKWNNFWAYKGATLFKPNLREIETAVGYNVEDEKSLITAGHEVKDKLEVEHLLVTRGEHGMALFTPDDVHFLPTQARQVHDVSGAGDTVIATIMAALAGGSDIVEAACLGNCAASVVIAEVGAIPVDPDKLKRICLE